MQNIKETFVYNTLANMLYTAERIIAKAQAHVAEGKATEVEVMDWKLIDDMLPFVRQIQIVTDNVKGAISRLAKVEAPKYEDNETTLSELLKRIDKTRSFISAISSGEIKDLDTLEIKLPWMPEAMSWTGAQYVNGFVLQNAYFHLITAYAIVRAKGVEIGKMDFIGNI